MVHNLGLLAFDLGAESGRAMLDRFDGGCVRSPSAWNVVLAMLPPGAATRPAQAAPVATS